MDKKGQFNNRRVPYFCNSMLWPQKHGQHGLLLIQGLLYYLLAALTRMLAQSANNRTLDSDKHRATHFKPLFLNL